MWKAEAAVPAQWYRASPISAWIDTAILKFDSCLLMQVYRRGLATNVHEPGVPDSAIQAIVRHEDSRTTQRSYIKTVPQKSSLPPGNGLRLRLRVRQLNSSNTWGFGKLKNVNQRPT
jgi:hypothetical protein